MSQGRSPDCDKRTCPIRPEVYTGTFKAAPYLLTATSDALPAGVGCDDCLSIGENSAAIHPLIPVGLQKRSINSRLVFFRDQGRQTSRSTKRPTSAFTRSHVTPRLLAHLLQLLRRHRHPISGLVIATELGISLFVQKIGTAARTGNSRNSRRGSVCRTRPTDTLGHFA